MYMFDKKFILGIVLVTALIIGGGIFLVSGDTKTASSQVEFSNGGKAELANSSIDWGKIAYQGGNKEVSFTIKNQGDTALKLRNVKTSCHCTKAEITIDGNVSPSFGMSGNSPWVGEVKPEGEAILKVIFDPAFHGVNGLGQIERYVKVETSDPAHRYLEFSAKGVVEK